MYTMVDVSEYCSNRALDSGGTFDEQYEFYKQCTIDECKDLDMTDVKNICDMVLNDLEISELEESWLENQNEKSLVQRILEGFGKIDRALWG